ncbi:hypothetical protein GCM10022393_31790 [Aquimarina addita]|uniref:Uncharacterized protein n=1 Tax=Aquimarina addita TaxID=870485 RepID=A0ABP6USY7_9FLAO
MNISIPLKLYYDSELISLEKPKHQISIELKNGNNKITSEPIECGVAKNIEGETKKLFATFSFNYDFDEINSKLTIVSSELNTPDSINFRIGHPGYPQITTFKKEESLNSTKKLNDITYKSTLFMGLESIIDKERINIKNAIIDESNKKGVTVFVKSPFPKMNLEDYQNLSLVYDVNEKTIEPFNFNKVYDVTKKIFHIESYFKDIVYFPSNQKFANVIGSTHDPDIKGQSWLELWRNSFKAKSKICASFEYNGFNCTNGSDNGKHLVGGHVILGDKASKVEVGSDDVYIIPICKAHNNNNKVFMMPIHVRRAVRLGGFMQDNFV